MVGQAMDTVKNTRTATARFMLTQANAAKTDKSLRVSHGSTVSPAGPVQPAFAAAFPSSAGEAWCSLVSGPINAMVFTVFLVLAQRLFAFESCAGLNQ